MASAAPNQVGNIESPGDANDGADAKCHHDQSGTVSEELPLKRLLNKRGIEVTTRSERCVRYLDEFTDQVLAYGGGSGSLIRKAIGEDPSCLYAHTCLAASSMFADKAQGFKTVELHLQEARNLLETGTEHEVLFFKAVQAWRKGDMNTSLDLHQIIAERYPRDIYSVSTHHDLVQPFTSVRDSPVLLLSLVCGFEDKDKGTDGSCR